MIHLVLEVKHIGTHGLGVRIKRGDLLEKIAEDCTNRCVCVSNRGHFSEQIF